MILKNVGSSIKNSWQEAKVTTAVAAAKKLEAEATEKLTEEEMKNALMKQKGYSESVASEAAARYANVGAKQAESVATTELTAAEAIEALMQENMTAEEAKEMLLRSGIITQKELEENATIELTGAKLAEAGADGVVIAGATGVTIANTGEALSFDLLTASIWANIKAMVAWLLTNPVGSILLVVGALTGAVIAAKSFEKAQKEAFEKATESAKKYKDEVSGIQSDIKEEKETIEEITDRYAELAQGVDTSNNKNLSLNTEEYEEFLELNEKLADIFPSLTKSYDKNGNAILGLGGSIDTVTEKIEKLIEREERLAKIEALKKLESYVDGEDGDGGQLDVIEGLESQYEDAKREAENYYNIFSKIKDGQKVNIGQGGYDPYVKYLKENYGLTDDELKSIQSTITKDGTTYVEFDFSKLEIDEARKDEIINSYQGVYNELSDVAEAAKIELENANKELSSMMMLWVEDQDVYKSGSEAFQTLMQNIVSSVDWNNLNIDNYDDAKEWIKKNILNILNGLNNEQEGQVTSIINSLFSDDFKNMSISQIRTYLGEIDKIFGTNWNEGKSKQIRDALGWHYGDDVEPLITKVQGFLSDEFDGKVTELSLDDLKVAANLEVDKDTIYSWKELKGLIEDVKAATKEDNYVDVLSGVESLSSGLDQLAEIYQDVKDGGNFDYSSILNNDDFKNTFGEYEEEYNNFIKTITNSPDDINACQESFNKLASAYVYGSKELINVTEESKNAVVALLRQKGITNALAIVEEQLAINTTYVANAQENLNKLKEKGIDFSGDLEDATAVEILELINEGKQLGIDTEALYLYLMQKVRANQITISTSGDVEGLTNLCKTLNIASEAIVKYTELKVRLDELENSGGSGSNYYRTRKSILEQMKKLEEEMNASLSEKLKGNSTDYFNDLNALLKFDDPDIGGSDNKQSFDWIEVLLSRIQRTITNLGKTVSATWKSWGSRNDALKQQISEITKEYNKQEEAAQRYWSLAESVTGLTPEEKAKIRNGSMDYNDEDLPDDKAEAINKYKDFYEKYLAAEDAKQDLNDDLATAAKTKFDNISAEFENILSMSEHEMSMLEGYVDQAEARGHIVSTKYYSEMKKIEENNIITLQKEYDELNSALTEAVNTGRIEKYSEEWYNMQGSINDVSKEILDANTNLIELENTMRELEWEAFDKTQELISKVTEESDFLVDLMSNDKMYDDDGNITEQGQATLGLHALNYNTYMSQADDYAEQLNKINAEIAEDPNNQTLIDKKYELIEAQRDAILSAEDEKQAMKDLMSDGYDAMLDSMSKLIDKRKEAMQSIKDLYDYEKNIAELNDEVTVLEKQVIAIQGDDSEENRAQLQQIQKSLEEARKNLEETEYDKYLSDQEKMLDTLQEETETWISERLDNIDGLIDGVIQSTNDNAETIKKTLETEAGEVGSELSTEMSNIWSTGGAASEVVTKYGNDFSSKLTTTNDILTGIKNGIKAMLDANNIKADMDIDSTKTTNNITPAPTPTTPTTPSTTPSTTTNNSSNQSSSSGWGSWFIKKVFTGNKNNLNTNTSIVDRLKWKDFDSSMSARRSYYYAMGGTGTYTGTAKQNTWMLQQMKSHAGFAKGGTIGGLINKSGEDGFILARTGEEVLSLEKISAMKDVFEAMNPIADMIKTMPTYTQLSGISGNSITNDIDMNIVLEGINNADEFITALKTDKKFEKFIQQITIGNAMGRNTLSKNRY